jgi:hypothetical protein
VIARYVASAGCITTWQTKMIDEITKRLAHKIWEIFDKDEIQNNELSNYRCAEGIMRRLLNDSYKLDEFRNFFSTEDYEAVRKLIEDADIARSKEDCGGD